MILKYIVLTISTAVIVQAQSLQRSLNCPKLTPRTYPPESVHDIRPDDIKYLASMGDSITAGLVAINTKDAQVNLSDIHEERGFSWLAGGDPKAVSLANFLKYYSPDLFGPSIGRNKVVVDTKAPSITATRSPENDKLNAAASGSFSFNITDQIKYLIPKIGKDTEAAKQWKMINIYIGSNDLVISCLSPNYTDIYSRTMTANLELVRENFDYAIVNLIGLFHVEKYYNLAEQVPGYVRPSIGPVQLHNMECSCCNMQGGSEVMAKNVDAFNDALESIAKANKENFSNTFSVNFQPMDVDASTIDPHAISNNDGYHPNLLGHSFYATFVWNELFKPSILKSKKLRYDHSLKPYCPTETDRIQTI